MTQFFISSAAEYLRWPGEARSWEITNCEATVVAICRSQVSSYRHTLKEGTSSYHFISPEWDLVSSILSILTTLPGLYLQYVRGHQDKKVAYSQLSLLAQLNVDADAMATRYQHQHTHAHTTVLLTDTAGVHLVMSHGSITSRYTTEIRYQATHGPLLSYLQHKHGWSVHTSNAINWKAHGTALRARLRERTQPFCEVSSRHPSYSKPCASPRSHPKLVPRMWTYHRGLDPYSALPSVLLIPMATGSHGYLESGIHHVTNSPPPCPNSSGRHHQRMAQL